MIYEAAGISRQGYSNQRNYNKKKQEMNLDILAQVKEKRISHPKMGSRPLFYACKINSIGITKFERLMSEHELTIPQRRKWIRTTDGCHDIKDRNLIYGKVLNGINQVIVGDITYYFSKNLLFYIFTLKDAYSGRILSLKGDVNMKAEVGIKALKEVIKLRGKENLHKVIHHTDAGSQYKSKAYKAVLTSINAEMSIANNCLENGIAEQLNDVIKNGYLDFKHIKTVEQLNTSLDLIKNLINKEKPVAGLGYKTPIEFEEMISKLKIEQRPLKTLYHFNKENIN
jgi:putative transposase